LFTQSEKPSCETKEPTSHAFVDFPYYRLKFQLLNVSGRPSNKWL